MNKHYLNYSIVKKVSTIFLDMLFVQPHTHNKKWRQEQKKPAYGNHGGRRRLLTLYSQTEERRDECQSLSYLLFFISPGPHALEWCCSNLGWTSPSQFIQSRFSHTCPAKPTVCHHKAISCQLDT